MNKFVSFNDIGYVAATFPVDAATQTYLKANHTNPKTGNVDINGKNLGVALGTDGTVTLPTGNNTASLLGIVIAYEMDGFASVQIKGGVDNVPTAAALTTGVKGLVVNASGAIAAGSEGAGTVAIVAKPSTANSLYASIIL